MAPKPSYSKPTSQLDLEARQKPDYVPPGVVKQGEDQGLSDNGYIAVDPIYQNHANDTEAPIRAEKGPEAKVFDNHYAEDVDFDTTGPEEGEAPEDEDESEDENESSSSSQQSGSGSGQAPPPSGGSTPPSSQS
jgi:hypothetical protein